MSEKLEIGTAFDKFIDRLKGYVERNFDNEKDVLCVVTDMEDLMKTSEEENMLENLDEEKSKSILKNRRLELALMRYLDREAIIK